MYHLFNGKWLLKNGSSSSELGGHPGSSLSRASKFREFVTIAKFKIMIFEIQQKLSFISKIGDILMK